MCIYMWVSCDVLGLKSHIYFYMQFVKLMVSCLFHVNHTSQRFSRVNCFKATFSDQTQ